ncbi:MAG: methylenetetrahydrofolate reductase [Phycisphaerae bacterium]|jgi:5,10-methylenetetrahydrofolate reductase|nr:methylenetetrahydrofolate reductase [Phycisphaerae bacterium]
MMSKFKEALATGQFVATGEIGPPKGTDMEECWQEAEHLRGKVVAINVTDIQSAVMRVSCLAVCAKLIEMGLEPVYQMVCRDRNRLALQADLLGASILGIENVLSLTGDHVMLGDHKGAKPVFDLDSVTLLQAISGLENGKDLGDNELAGSPSFFKGAIVTPCADPIEPQIIKLEKKVASGAQFIQTQAVYDPATFEQFMKKIEHIKVPILVGIVVLKSAGMAKFMNNNVAGVEVPDALIKEMADTPKEDRKKKTAEISARLIREMKPMCQGVHLMPLGWTDIVRDILSQAEVA